MVRTTATTARIQALLDRLYSITHSGELHWERQLGSAHRYARWNNNLLILGPANPPTDSSIPRYLFVTPFDSPSCIEVNSDDAELGPSLMKLVNEVEGMTHNEPATDPFAIDDDILYRLT
ncbi:MAG TPA: hypothetical protein VLE19_13745 [Pyrinomonadaceae bacterium]|nr:hypothetical protein [Pyrinomonadaceae bacterium]